MWWYGRGNSGGSYQPEEKKAKMWPGRGDSGGSWPLPEVDAKSVIICCSSNDSNTQMFAKFFSEKVLFRR